MTEMEMTNWAVTYRMLRWCQQW